jgi:hypothetical protein
MNALLTRQTAELLIDETMTASGELELSTYSIELEYDEYDYIYRYLVTEISTGKLIAALEDRFIDVATEKVDFLLLELDLAI